MTTSRWILLRMRNISNKSCRENQNTHFMTSNIFSENRAVYEIMSKNMVELDRPKMTIWRHVACWISKATRAQAYARVPEPTHHTSKHAYACARAHRQNMKYVLLLHSNNGFVNAPHCYVNVHSPPYSSTMIRIMYHRTVTAKATAEWQRISRRKYLNPSSEYGQRFDS